MQKLGFSFYHKPCEQLARDLLGKYLVRVYEDGLQKVGKIVETEAYLGPQDKACHSYKGKTPRTEVLFGTAGRVYVYLIYGLHYLFNITAGEKGAAVLIRALEPIENVSEKTNGPGLFTRSFDIDKSHNKIDLTKNGGLFLAESGREEGLEIGNSPRIGVDYAEEWKELPLRFFVKDNKFISRFT